MLSGLALRSNIALHGTKVLVGARHAVAPNPRPSKVFITPSSAHDVRCLLATYREQRERQHMDNFVARIKDEKRSHARSHTLCTGASTGSAASAPLSPPGSLAPVLFSVLVACAGSLAFGYHLGVVNGPLEAISADLNIAGQPALEGLIVSSTLAGAAFGSMSGGGLADTLGRNKSLLLASVPLLIGPLLSTNAQILNVMLAGRFITGLAIGLTSAVVPTYISEIAPTSLRGALGTLNQLVICLGILAALWANVVLPMTDWRTMFLIGAAPAVALGIGMLLSPESPRWLESKGRAASAEVAAQQLWGANAAAEMDSGAAGDKPAGKSDVSFMEMLSTRSCQIGLLLFAFQQFAGINAIVYFSTSVFRQAGVASDTLASVGVGAVNVLGTIIAASIIEKAGRTTLLSNSYLGQAAAMFAMSAGFALPALKEFSAPIAVVGTLFYILSFALGAGPVTALILPELNDAKIRGRAVAAAFVCHWVCNVLVGQTFMLGMQKFGLPAVYGFFGTMALVAAVFIKTQVPETRGKSFDQIQKELSG